MSNSNPIDVGNALPMSVDNVAFLLDRLGQDCSPLQYLRELTQNGIEAIHRSESPGSIIWDVDWITYDLTNVMKLCVIDTGDGMTGEEMQKFINQLSSSGSEQSITANYGIGAKISAATKNPSGVVYQSWKNGQGSMIHLEKNTITGEYGLRQFELSDGTYSHFVPLSDDVKPEEIDNHGTKVILYGDADENNTMQPPEEASAPSRWVSKYLNTRYFDFGPNITIKSREGWDNPRSDKDRNLLRNITGQKSYLDKHCQKYGTHKIEDTNVHWWILRDEPAITNNSGYIESGGHVAALYQNELYDRATSRSGTAHLQQFGILFGTKFVVLYIEPITNDKQNLTTNTARTTLLLNGEALPWADWAYEFRVTMPTELVEFVKSKEAGASDKDHVSTIKDRLKGIMDLYKVSRYKPSPQGVYLSDESSSVSAGTSTNDSSSSQGKGTKSKDSTRNSNFGKKKGTRDGEVGNIYHLFEKKDGTQSKKIESDPFPIVKWISVEDGTREEHDIEDKAAKYLVEQNTLLVNADFRVFKDMIYKLCKEKETTQNFNIEKTVEEVVHSWFGQALVETVIGVQQLKGGKEWDSNVVKSALSPEALTASVMQRYHVHIACRRELGAKLGKAISS